MFSAIAVLCSLLQSTINASVNFLHGLCYTYKHRFGVRLTSINLNTNYSRLSMLTADELELNKMRCEQIIDRYDRLKSLNKVLKNIDKGIKKLILRHANKIKKKTNATEEELKMLALLSQLYEDLRILRTDQQKEYSQLMRELRQTGYRERVRLPNYDQIHEECLEITLEVHSLLIKNRINLHRLFDMFFD